MTRKKIIFAIAAIFVLIVWLASTAQGSKPYRYSQHHNPDGEPVNVVEVMGVARNEQ